MMHCYPEIVTEQKDGRTHKVVWFHLSFWEDEYSMKLPVELAFRLIENAIEAPEAVALLEEKIRAIEDIQNQKIRAIKDTEKRDMKASPQQCFFRCWNEN